MHQPGMESGGGDAGPRDAQSRLGYPLRRVGHNHQQTGGKNQEQAGARPGEEVTGQTTACEMERPAEEPESDHASRTDEDDTPDEVHTPH
jgi:hypothetical protein